MTKNLKFSDLSPFDLSTVKTMAVREFAETSKTDASTILIEKIFDMIQAKGYNIVRDETREPTWEGPKDSWYSKDQAQKKKSWQI